MLVPPLPIGLSVTTPKSHYKVKIGTPYIIDFWYTVTCFKLSLLSTEESIRQKKRLFPVAGPHFLFLPQITAFTFLFGLCQK